MTLELLGLVAKRVNLLLADGIGTRSPSASMSTARRRTAPSRRARTRWQHSRAFGLATRHLLQCMSSRHNTFNDRSASTGTTQAFGVNDTDQIVLDWTERMPRIAFAHPTRL